VDNRENLYLAMRESLLQRPKDPDVGIAVATFKPCEFLMEMNVQVCLV